MAGQTRSVANYAAANGQFTTDSPQRNAAVITPPWPSVSESVLRVRLGVTVFCILALHCVTLWVTARRLNVRAFRPQVVPRPQIYTLNTVHTCISSILLITTEQKFLLWMTLQPILHIKEVLDCLRLDLLL